MADVTSEQMTEVSQITDHIYLSGEGCLDSTDKRVQLGITVASSSLGVRCACGAST